MEKRHFKETVKKQIEVTAFLSSIIRRLLQGICICLTLSACHTLDKEVQEVLNSVEAKQKKSLKAFMEYYTNNKEHLEVSKFIVANLLNKYSIEGENNLVYQVYIDSIDKNWQTINSPKNYNYKDKANNLPVKPSFIKKRDIDIIQTDSLIQQMNAAFSTWKQTPWSVQYSDGIFEEYIAPYRIADEPLEYYWRTDAYTRHKDWLYECKDSSLVAICSFVYQRLDYQTNNLFWGEPLQSYTTNSLYRRGTCSDYAIYTTMIMRALGIPTAIDFVPYWGDGNNGHSFNSLILPDGTCKGYNNKEDLTNGLTLSGKVPKVYRKVYGVQRNSLLYKYRDTEYIPNVFAQHDIIDVTEQYDIPITDISIVPKLYIPESQIVYLTVFSPKNWQPIAWAEYADGKADFRNIGVGYTSHDSSSIKGENYGEGCLFMPVSYLQEKMQALNYPFILKEEGEPRYLFPNITETETVILFRKYPRKKRIIDFAKKAKEGYFQLSNERSFAQSELVYYIDSIPASHIQTIPLINKKYRYMRFYKRNGGISMSEIGCLDTNKQVIPSKVLADPILMKDPELKNICDGNALSYYDIGNLKDIWIGLDFERPTALSSLFFCPRTDNNDIVSGDEYELFYWNDKWISLGKKTADNNNLVYKNVPKNSLLWLRDLTTGKEERPFTYEHSKQIWW